MRNIKSTNSLLCVFSISHDTFVCFYNKKLIPSFRSRKTSSNCVRKNYYFSYLNHGNYF